jgi:multiple sugar transport system ATP-binding protein
MAEVVLERVSKSYGQVDVLRDVDLAIGDGEFVVFVGPSGCGKSTLLRMIAGLEEITQGTLRIGGQVANDLSPRERGIAMVFQSYALYPHRTVRGNMEWGLRLAGMGRAEIVTRVVRAARMLQIEDLLDRRPHQLSGGQRQRVAIGRAIVRNPAVFLFDEPLSNLDAALRVSTRREIAELHRQLGATTMIYVTHDQVEAMTLADRIVVLNAGRIQQVGTPLELYRRPANLFVAGFIGSPRMNFLPATAKMQEDGKVVVTAGTLGSIPAPANLQIGEALTLGVRPEHLHVAHGGATVRAELVEHLGDEDLIEVSLEDGQRLTIKTHGAVGTLVGDRLSVAIDPATVHLFDATGQIVGG